MKTIFLTFDFDWAPDFVVADLLDLLSRYSASSTLFCTHQSPILGEIRSQKALFEIGIHPNFNPLLFSQNPRQATADRVIGDLKEIVPEAISVRSHSMTQNALLLEKFSDFGLTHECNMMIPLESGSIIVPFRIPCGLIRIPYCFEDDDAMQEGHLWNVEPFLQYKGLCVVDFHPIHVFLNCPSMDFYAAAKPYMGDRNKLRSMRNIETKGPRTLLHDILKCGLFEFRRLETITTEQY